MAFPDGVRPDEVIKDHRAEAMFMFAPLRADLDRTGVENWLRRASNLFRNRALAGALFVGTHGRGTHSPV